MVIPAGKGLGPLMGVPMSHVRIKKCPLKERSRPSVSNVKSGDVRLATGIGTATSLVNVMKSI